MQGLPLFASRRNSFLHMLLIAVPLVLLLTLFSQSAFAQRTYVITEGEQVIVHKTYIDDPVMALSEAGIKADPHEYHVFQRKPHVYDISVVRDDVVVVMNCGEKLYVEPEESTVGELLARIGVALEEGYEISCPLDALLEDGMTITVEIPQQQGKTKKSPVISNGIVVLPSGEVMVNNLGV